MKRERFDTTDRNAAIFMAPAGAKHYGTPAPFAAEAMILIRHKEAFAGKRLLDLGVGAGTTQYLAPFCGKLSRHRSVAGECWLWRVRVVPMCASPTWIYAISASSSRRVSISSSVRETF